jgi:hypothetical protein
LVVIGGFWIDEGEEDWVNNMLDYQPHLRRAGGEANGQTP